METYNFDFLHCFYGARDGAIKDLIVPCFSRWTTKPLKNFIPPFFTFLYHSWAQVEMYPLRHLVSLRGLWGALTTHPDETKLFLQRNRIPRRAGCLHRSYYITGNGVRRLGPHGWPATHRLEYNSKASSNEVNSIDGREDLIKIQIT